MGGESDCVRVQDGLERNEELDDRGEGVIILLSGESAEVSAHVLAITLLLYRKDERVQAHPLVRVRGVFLMLSLCVLIHLPYKTVFTWGARHLRFGARVISLCITHRTLDEVKVPSELESCTSLPSYSRCDCIDLRRRMRVA